MENQDHIAGRDSLPKRESCPGGNQEGIYFSLEEINQIQEASDASLEPLPVIAPGLVDLQINGYQGVDFNDPALQPEQIESVSKALLHTGVTSYYPTLITGAKDKTAALIRSLSEAVRRKGFASRMIGGIHLEGPFISPEDGPRGAHPRPYCTEPDIQLLKAWQDMASGMIRIFTLAPELRGSIELIKAAETWVWWLG